MRKTVPEFQFNTAISAADQLHKEPEIKNQAKEIAKLMNSAKPRNNIKEHARNNVNN